MVKSGLPFKIASAGIHGSKAAAVVVVVSDEVDAPVVSVDEGDDAPVVVSDEFDALVVVADEFVVLVEEGAVEDVDYEGSLSYRQICTELYERSIPD